MNPFGDSPFDDIFSQFFGGKPRNARHSHSDNGGISGDEVLENISTKKGNFLIFDFSSVNVFDVRIVDELEENEYGEEVHTGKKLLEIDLDSSSKSRFVLPKNLSKSKVSWTHQNGLLEVFLRK